MISLHVTLHPLTSEASHELMERFSRDFFPAVRTQPGFRVAHLLRADPVDADIADDTIAALVLTLSFDEEAQRLAWVETSEHQEIWPTIRALCRDVTRVRYEVLAAVDSASLEPFNE